MKVLLDMGLSPRTAETLRASGYDAVHLRERRLHRLPDERVMRMAKDEGRVVVTFDLDFADLLALQRASQPSVVLFRLESFTTEQVSERTLDVLKRFSEELTEGAIVTVDPGRERIRKLPFW